MKLSKEGQEALEKIRFKVVNQQYDFDRIEVQCLALVYEEIQLQAVGKKKPLDISCHSCVSTAANICNNFIKYHEERVITEPAKVERKTIKESIEGQFDLKQMTIEQLKSICDEQGIKYHHKAKEGKLIEAILEANI